MYSYITSELPEAVFENFKQVDRERVSIFGHSMGGHGALTLVRRICVFYIYYERERERERDREG